jgi:hypothetical protein
MILLNTNISPTLIKWLGCITDTVLCEVRNRFLLIRRPPSRSQWSCGLRRTSATARLLGMRVTHYTPTWASRIDRICITENLKRRKQGVAKVAAAFSDHFVVILRLSIDVPVARRGRGCWRMNTSFLCESTFQDK